MTWPEAVDMASENFAFAVLFMAVAWVVVTGMRN